MHSSHVRCELNSLPGRCRRSRRRSSPAARRSAPRSAPGTASGALGARRLSSVAGRYLEGTALQTTLKSTQTAFI